MTTIPNGQFFYFHFLLSNFDTFLWGNTEGFVKLWETEILPILYWLRFFLAIIFILLNPLNKEDRSV